jgi:hypothetical protein
MLSVPGRWLSLAIALWCLCATIPLAWEPSRFEIFCGTPYPKTDPPEGFGPTMRFDFYLDRLGEALDVPAEDPCLPEAKRSMLADYAEEILRRYEEMGFTSPAPERLGPVVLDGEGRRVVRIFADPTFHKYAETVSASDRAGRRPFDPASLAVVRLAPDEFASRPPAFVYRLLAHEMFHVVQRAQQILTRDHTDGLLAPWLGEGTADAVAAHLMREHFGAGGYQPPLTVHGSRSVYGLRPYDEAFTWRSGPARGRWGHKLVTPYTSSSFWTHLAERYFDGEFDYLRDWFAVPDVEPGGDDWLRWIDDLLRYDEGGIDQPFYLIFPDFVAHYAAWGEKKYPHIGEETWLEEAFGGCHEVTLSPAQPTRGLNLELEPISAQCLRIHVGGLQAGEDVAVQVMAYDDEKEALDNLHLTASRLGGELVRTGGSFDCYDQTRGRGPEHLCLDKPFTGRRGEGRSVDDKGDVAPGAGGDFVKTWYGHEQRPEGASLNNLFFIVHAPVRPRDAAHDVARGAKPQAVRLAIGIDVTRLTTTTAGKAEAAHGHVQGDMGHGIVPMQGGGAPSTGGGPAAFAKQIFNIPSHGAALEGLLPGGALAKAREAMSGISMLTLEHIDAVSGGVDTKARFVLALLPEERIPFGAAGTYEAGVMGVGPNGDMIVDPGEEPSGRIEVLQFSDELLRVQASGSYCLYADLDRKTGECRRPQSFRGEVIKPFGWTYDGKRRFTSIDTPGMSEYGEHYTKILAGRMPGMPEPFRRQRDPRPGTADGAGGGAGGDPSGAGGEATASSRACECSCEAFEKMQERMEQLTEQSESGQAGLPPSEMMDAAACAQECAMAWAQCAKDSKN